MPKWQRGLLLQQEDADERWRIESRIEWGTPRVQFRREKRKKKKITDSLMRWTTLNESGRSSSGPLCVCVGC